MAEDVYRGANPSFVVGKIVTEQKILDDGTAVEHVVSHVPGTYVYDPEEGNLYFIDGRPERSLFEIYHTEEKNLQWHMYYDGECAWYTYKYAKRFRINKVDGEVKTISQAAALAFNDAMDTFAPFGTMAGEKALYETYDRINSLPIHKSYSPWFRAFLISLIKYADDLDWLNVVRDGRVFCELEIDYMKMAAAAGLKHIKKRAAVSLDRVIVTKKFSRNGMMNPDNEEHRELFEVVESTGKTSDTFKVGKLDFEWYWSASNTVAFNLLINEQVPPYPYILEDYEPYLLGPAGASNHKRYRKYIMISTRKSGRPRELEKVWNWWHEHITAISKNFPEDELKRWNVTLPLATYVPELYSSIHVFPGSGFNDCVRFLNIKIEEYKWCSYVYDEESVKSKGMLLFYTLTEAAEDAEERRKMYDEIRREGSALDMRPDRYRIAVYYDAPVERVLEAMRLIIERRERDRKRKELERARKEKRKR